ncbi:integrase [Gossypium australe]|uniref:Integrase n=1 Tax=Gossypium australe TaxID=47621 RepID=A0A5B6UYW1_9ROSI|nr:integrase [Gossypium australe]
MGKANVVANALGQKKNIFLGSLQYLVDLELQKTNFELKLKHDFVENGQTIKFSIGDDGMKCEIFDFVNKCLVSQQVKVKHKVSSSLLQSITILQ